MVTDLEPKLDWTITLGNLLTAAAWIGGAVWYAARVALRIDRIESKMALLWAEFKRRHGLNGNGHHDDDLAG